MFTRIGLFAIAAAIGIASTSASAASYRAFSHHEGGGPEHSLWFSNDGSVPSNPAGSTGADPNHFLFENAAPGFGKFKVNGNTASLTGRVLNAAGQGFDMVLNFLEVARPTHTKNPFGADETDWTFYSITSGMLTSINGDLADFDVTMMTPPGKDLKVQYGVGANDKNKFKLGLSTWINMDEKNCQANCQSYKGDINIVLAPMPVPAGLLLLPAGLGLLGAAGRYGRRRRKS